MRVFTSVVYEDYFKNLLSADVVNSYIYKTNSMLVFINLKTETSQKKFEVRNNFMDKLSDCIIDAFILFLKKRGNVHLARAFCIIFIPKNLSDKDFLSFINGNYKYFGEPKIKSFELSQGG